MVNRKFLIEWFEEEQIVTYEQKEAKYEPFLPRGSEAFSLEDDESYEAYWADWFRRSGYRFSEETLDICLLASSNIDVRQFLEVAKSKRIRFASPTSWNVRELQIYIKRTERSVVSLDDTLSPILVFELNDAQKLYAYSGDGGAFSNTDISIKDISPVQAQSKKIPSKKEKKPTLLDDNKACDPRIRDLRKKIKAEISHQCVTIDQKR